MSTRMLQTQLRVFNGCLQKARSSVVNILTHNNRRRKRMVWCGAIVLRWFKKWGNVLGNLRKGLWVFFFFFFLWSGWQVVVCAGEAVICKVVFSEVIVCEIIICKVIAFSQGQVSTRLASFPSTMAVLKLCKSVFVERMLPHCSLVDRKRGRGQGVREQVAVLLFSFFSHVYQIILWFFYLLWCTLSTTAEYCIQAGC